MDVRRSRLPKNPVNIGRSAQKSAKQGDGPSARGTQSTKEGNSHRDKVKTCPQVWLRLHKPEKRPTTKGFYKHVCPSFKATFKVTVRGS
jgi:hypothetical protein